MRTELNYQRMRRRMMPVAAALLAGVLGLSPRGASAEGLFDLFFGGFQKQQHQAPPQASFFADPFGQQINRRHRRNDRLPPAALLFACEAATASIFR